MNDYTWYTDTYTSHHMTPDLSNLHFDSGYNGPNQVIVGDDSVLAIKTISHSLLHISTHPFQLNNILHVP